MRFVYTDGKNVDFIYLCQQLDNHLNWLAGGEEHRTQYVQHNTLEKIQDAYVAYHGEQPVGGGAFRFYEEGVAEVKRVFVLPEYRGKKVASALMKCIEEKAKEKGFHTLRLETGADFADAVALYTKLGYTVVENYGQYKGMEQSVCMEKKLR